MPTKKIKRNGDCYEAAGKFMLDNGTNKSGYTLVHGLVTGQGSLQGVRYGHAWIEQGDTVIDLSNGRNLRLPKVVYYAIGHCEPKCTYTAKQAMDKMLKTGHFGPWDYNPPL